MDGHHRGPEAVLAEGSVLVGASLVVALQFLEDFVAQHTLALAMDKHDFLPFVLLVLVHHAAELLHLAVQHILVAQPVGIVQQLMDVEVDFQISKCKNS